MAKNKIPSNKGNNKEVGDYEVGYKKPPKSGQIKKGEVRNPKGAGASTFLQFRKLAQSMGNELAYKPNGEPIKIKIGGKEKHVTYVELMIYMWMTDKKYMHEFRDSAFGKVPQNLDVTSGGEALTIKIVKASDDTNKAEK